VEVSSSIFHRSDHLFLIIIIESTTIQLIQRFYDPEQGEVLLDGIDIKTLNVAWLRSHIGVVSQEPVLFTGSIEQNIRFGKQTATDDEVQAAAKMANAHDFIMALPEVFILSFSLLFIIHSFINKTIEL
jgi:ABC-type multidrug transport system fused ATPase/permease subunit